MRISDWSSDVCSSDLFREPQDGKSAFVTTRVDPDVARTLADEGVTVTGVVESNLLRDLLSWVVPVLLIFGLWMLVIRKMANRQGFGSFMAVGKSRATIYVETDTQVTLDAVAGVAEAKDELHEIIEFLQDPERYGDRKSVV